MVLVILLTLLGVVNARADSDDCEAKKGIWISQLQPVGKGRMEEKQVGLCLDPSKSHEFGKLNEANSPSLEIVDFVTGEQFDGAKVFHRGLPVMICNYSKGKIHHGGPAAASLLNPVKSGECKDVYPLSRTTEDRKPYYALTGIWTPADVEKAGKSLEARIEKDGWKLRDPNDPKSWEKPEIEAQRNSQVSTKKSKAIGSGPTGGHPKKPSDAHKSKSAH